MVQNYVFIILPLEYSVNMLSELTVCLECARSVMIGEKSLSKPIFWFALHRHFTYDLSETDFSCFVLSDVWLNIGLYPGKSPYR